jgi:hypothetical protein
MKYKHDDALALFLINSLERVLKRNDMDKIILVTTEWYDVGQCLEDLRGVVERDGNLTLEEELLMREKEEAIK